MSTPSPMDREMAAIERLTARATPGPWVTTITKRRKDWSLAVVPAAVVGPKATDEIVVMGDRYDERLNSDRADAKFIAAARVLIPTLAAEVKLLRRLLREAQAGGEERG